MRRRESEQSEWFITAMLVFESRSLRRWTLGWWRGAGFGFGGGWDRGLEIGVGFGGWWDKGLVWGMVGW